jgi:hypothetical protein
MQPVGQGCVQAIRKAQANGSPSGRTRKGDRYLRRILVQSAWAAARTRDCFFAALFYRIAQRLGMKKAAVAVAHRLVTIVYLLIRDGGVYYERGGDYFDRRNPARTARAVYSRRTPPKEDQ